MRTLRLFLPVALATGLWAQDNNKPLTNTDIESMLTAGLPESTIVLKIEIAVDQGLVDLDASSAALAVLTPR